MATTINASTSNGLIQTADTSGVLALQAADTTIASVSSTGVAVTGAITATGQIAALKTGTSVTTTSGTSAVLSSIPSWAKRITIYFNGVTCSGNTTMVLNSVSAGYTNTQSRLNATGTVTNSNASGSTFTMTQTAPTTSFAKYTLSLVNPSTYVYVLDGSMQSTTNYNLTLGGVTVGAILSSITIAGGTFSAGEINIFYE